MKGKFFVSILLSAALTLGTLPALAQHGQGGGPPAGKGPGGPPPSTPASSHAESKTQPSTSSSSAPHGKMTVGEHLAHNTGLANKLEGLLGVNSLAALEAKAQGFQNLGQFVSAVHVSHNLDIPFDQLKTKLLADESLGQAIHDLKPQLNAKAEAKKAKRQADQDLKESETKS